MADYIVHDTTLVATSNAIRKVEGSSDLISPLDYPKHIRLMGILPTATASGSIAHITDGADDVPTSSCEVEIAPTLTGVSSVSVVRQGKNLLNPSIVYSQTTIYTYDSTTGAVTVNSSDTSAWSTKEELPLKKGTYTINNPQGRVQYRLKSENYETDHNITTTSGTITLSADDGIKFKFGLGSTYPFTASYQLEVGSTASAYEAFVSPTYTASLGRTVYGGSVDIVNGTGTDEYSVPTALNSLTWSKTTIDGHDAFYSNLPNSYIDSSSGNLGGVCDDYLVTTDANLGTDKTIRFYYNSNFNISRCVIRDDQYASYTGAQFKEAVTGNIVYLLAESARTDFTFTDQEVSTRLGVNNFFSNVGDMSVTYRRDINLALGGE